MTNLRAWAVASVMLTLQCGGSGTTSGLNKQGAEGGHCYPNDTCDRGLTCLSHLCVNTDSGSAGAGPINGVADGGRSTGGPVSSGAATSAGGAFGGGAFSSGGVPNGGSSSGTGSAAGGAPLGAGGLPPGTPGPLDAGSECDSYCAEYAATCNGYLNQYASKDQCLHLCGFWPKTGHTGDVVGNTIQCRVTYLKKVEMGGNPDNYCINAGPSAPMCF